MRWDLYFTVCAAVALIAVLLVYRHRQMTIALAAVGAVPLTSVRVRKPATLYAVPQMRMRRDTAGVWSDAGDDSGNG